MAEAEKPVLYVNSGTCRKCECGLPTSIKDDSEEELRTGDIVMGYTVDPSGVANFDGLTVVVADQWQSYSNGTHVLLEAPPVPYVMGLFSVDLATSEEWRVRRVKKYEDVIPGEHWKDFGFNFT